MARSVARPDSETLERLHHGEQLTIAHLAARFGVAAQTVHAAEQRPAPAA
jgi:DNA-binding transcriptional regulator YiaG